jgi:hypothetical protein
MHSEGMDVCRSIREGSGLDAAVQDSSTSGRSKSGTDMKNWPPANAPPLKVVPKIQAKIITLVESPSSSSEAPTDLFIRTHSWLPSPRSTRAETDCGSSTDPSNIHQQQSLSADLPHLHSSSIIHQRVSQPKPPETSLSSNHASTSNVMSVTIQSPERKSALKISTALPSVSIQSSSSLSHVLSPNSSIPVRASPLSRVATRNDAEPKIKRVIVIGEDLQPAPPTSEPSQLLAVRPISSLRRGSEPTLSYTYQPKDLPVPVIPQVTEPADMFGLKFLPPR